MLSDPSKRPTAEEVFASGWVQDLAPNSLEAVLNLNITSLKQYGNQNKLKKAVMTFICSRMKDEEVASLKEIFVAMDKNGDGHLTLDELKEGMAKAGVDSNEVIDLFNKMDTDGSGVVDYTGNIIILT